MNHRFRGLLLAAAAAGLSLVAGPALAADVYLRAAVTTKTMPDGEVVTFWGFAQDSAFEARDGEVTVPGPELHVAQNDNRLHVHVDNDLPVPISIHVPGLRAIGRVLPVRTPDGRIRSFDRETEPGNTAPVTYSFVMARGSYIYQSATHPAVQVQMGLYGAAVRERVDDRRAYPGTPTYEAAVSIFLSEVDPALHEAVANGDYGPGLAMTSTVDYTPRYFLVNGAPFEDDPGFEPDLPIPGGGERTLVRFFNAGLTTRVPTLIGTRMRVIAEDGHRVPWQRDRAALVVPALKTFDVLVQPVSAGRYPLFDRRLGLYNGAATGAGGMLRYLTASGGPPPFQMREIGRRADAPTPPSAIPRSVRTGHGALVSDGLRPSLAGQRAAKGTKRGAKLTPKAAPAPDPKVDPKAAPKADRVHVGGADRRGKR